jgi:hypothetical protein
MLPHQMPIQRRKSIRHCCRFCKVRLRSYFPPCSVCGTWLPGFRFGRLLGDVFTAVFVCGLLLAIVAVLADAMALP